MPERLRRKYTGAARRETEHKAMKQLRAGLAKTSSSSKESNGTAPDCTVEAAARLVRLFPASLKSPHQTVEAAVHMVTLLAASLKSKCPCLLALLATWFSRLRLPSESKSRR